ncbi:MAG: pyruvate kinase [Candidatus Epulonipiscioides saccharophilum]|nr:MAG: pyruvate kinase [Epulopiscium sp. AS2M-Bin001]
MRKTKIIATVGPKTRDEESLKKIIKAGASAIRLNFSHDNQDTHKKTALRVMKIREELGTPTALVLDTKGPEIRTGVLTGDNEIELQTGQTFILTTDEMEGTSEKVSITYKELPHDLSEGNRVLLDDGLIELIVDEIKGNDIICTVKNGSHLGSRKGINIPNVRLNLPSLTEKDISDIQLGAELGFDFIAASFIRKASDIIKIRNILEEHGGRGIQIIAKIENQEGVDNIDAILQVADAIMVARGDLGVEIPAEEVPMIQKSLIKKANLAGKPVVTATQMLESMVVNPRPTRAEVSDVANAVFDGTSAIMLSGETAKGDYPIEALTMMVNIAKEAEQSKDIYNLTYRSRASLSMTHAMSNATCQAARQLNAAAIITVTKSGYTARAVSKFKPMAPIVTCTPEPMTYRQLNLVWGCVPYLITIEKEETDEIFAKAVAKAEEVGIANQGDVVVITAGVPVGVAGTTNILKVQYVGNILARGIGCGNNIITGRACVANVVEEAEETFIQGDILVARSTDNSFLPFMKKASAIVVEDATQEENNHAAIVGRTLDIPVIFAAGNATDTVKKDLTITLDTKEGLVYNGVVCPE